MDSVKLEAGMENGEVEGLKDRKYYNMLGAEWLRILCRKTKKHAAEGSKT